MLTKINNDYRLNPSSHAVIIPTKNHTTPVITAPKKK